jgi:hypothetical protein
MIFSAARTRRIQAQGNLRFPAHPRLCGAYQAATTKQQKNAHYQEIVRHLETVWWHVFLNWSSAAAQMAENQHTERPR